MSDLREHILQLQDQSFALTKIIQAASAVVGRPRFAELATKLIEEAAELADQLNEALDSANLPKV